MMHKGGDWAAAAATMTPFSTETPPLQLRISGRVRYAVRGIACCACLEAELRRARQTSPHVAYAPRARATVALALDAQILDAVPFDAAADLGDELVDVVLTPTRVLGPGAGAWK